MLTKRQQTFFDASMTIIQTHGMNCVHSIEIKQFIADANILKPGQEFAREDFDGCLEWISKTGYKRSECGQFLQYSQGAKQ